MLRGGYAVLRAFERETGLKVGQSNADYHAADLRGANSFQIG